MSKRTVYAELVLEDSKAFDENDMGPIEYLEREFGWMEQSGVEAKKMLIVDTDCDDWDRYLNYLFQWAFENAAEETTESPLSFNAWKEMNGR